jgi:pimeloyl-ACP methyl ester carboxylesterase
VIETEPSAQAIAYRLANQRHDSRPTTEAGRAILYVSHHSADQELRSDSWVGGLVPKDSERGRFYACDVRGVGESRPDTCGENSFLKPYGSDYFYAIHGLMLDRPYLGQKVWDLLQVLRWMASTGHESVHLVAQGWGTLPATFAALLNDSVDALTLKGGLASYQSVATSEAYSWPLSSFLPGVLESFDLPDCYRVLEKRLSLEWV